MGRKKIDEPRVPYTSYIKPNDFKEIQRLAKKLGISPSLMGSNLIEMGLDDARLLEKLGLLKIALIAGDVLNKVKGKAFRGEEIGLRDIQ